MTSTIDFRVRVVVVVLYTERDTDLFMVFGDAMTTLATSCGEDVVHGGYAANDCGVRG